jgi:uncharacterized protein
LRRIKSHLTDLARHASQVSPIACVDHALVQGFPLTSEPKGHPAMPITALYASLLVPLFILLSVRVIRWRREAKVAVGDGGDVTLLRRMRVHANFAEYVPFAVLMLALAESLQAPALLLHLCGASLLAGRLSHAYGVSQQPENLRFRVTGMAVTFTVLGVLAATCLLRLALR